MYPGLRQASISHTHVILAIQCYVNRPTLKVINVYLVNVSFFNFDEHCSFIVGLRLAIILDNW